VTFKRERDANAALTSPQSLERYAFLAEPADDQLVVVGYQSNGQSTELVTIDARSGRERRLRLENAQRFAQPMPWGSGQAIVTLQRPQPAASDTPPTVETFSSVEEFEASRQRTQQGARDVAAEGQSSAIIDLETMQVEWTGPQAEAPPPRVGYRCGGPFRAGRMRPPTRFMGIGSEPRHALNTAAGAFVLETPERAAAASCAITGDGEHLVVVAPPFVHHYAIAAN
jgi:hypothetical protein